MINKIKNYKLIHFICITCLLTICFVTYYNFKLRKEVDYIYTQIKIISEKNQQLGLDKSFYIASDSIESKYLPDVKLVSDKKNAKLYELLRESNCSVVILESASHPCTSCLDMALSNWKSRIGMSFLKNKPSLLLVSSGDGRRASLLSQEYNLENARYIDSTGQLIASLKLKDLRTVVLFVNKSGLVIYATILNSKSAEPYITFLDKIFRYCSNI